MGDKVEGLIKLLPEDVQSMIESIPPLGMMRGTGFLARLADKGTRRIEVYQLRKLLDASPDTHLPYLLELFLLVDIDMLNKMDGRIGQVKRPACIALDGIGGA